MHWLRAEFDWGVEKGPREVPPGIQVAQMSEWGRNRYRAVLSGDRLKKGKEEGVDEGRRP
jgi:hypothetical protein